MRSNASGRRNFNSGINENKLSITRKRPFDEELPNVVEAKIQIIMAMSPELREKRREQLLDMRSYFANKMERGFLDESAFEKAQKIVTDIDRFLVALSVVEGREREKLFPRQAEIQEERTSSRKRTIRPQVNQGDKTAELLTVQGKKSVVKTVYFANPRKFYNNSDVIRAVQSSFLFYVESEYGIILKRFLNSNLQGFNSVRELSSLTGHQSRYVSGFLEKFFSSVLENLPNAFIEKHLPNVGSRKEFIDCVLKPNLRHFLTLIT